MASELFCIIPDQIDQGDAPESFPVRFIATQTVHGLKIAIKEANSNLATVATHKIILYQNNLPEADKYFKKNLNDKLQDLSKVVKLRASCLLSQYFGDLTPPERGKVHILIQISPRESRDPRPCRPGRR